MRSMFQTTVEVIEASHICEEMEQAKMVKATAQQEKAVAEADLEGTQKELFETLFSWCFSMVTICHNSFYHKYMNNYK